MYDARTYMDKNNNVCEFCVIILYKNLFDASRILYSWSCYKEFIALVIENNSYEMTCLSNIV